MAITESKLVLLSVDLAGYTRAVASLDALTVARFLDAWYRQCADAIRRHGGRVVKYMGDACLAVFPPERTVDAVDAARELADAVAPIAAEHHLPLRLGGNVHLAVVAEGEFGPDDDRRYDVLGSGVNQLFLMGGGAGLRITEPVYRQLPNERRAAWQRHKPPATYVYCG
jgi:adenylate cyclase